MKTKDYYEQLREVLKDEAEAAAYLDAALEDGDPKVFLLALRNVVLAQGSIQTLAGKTQLHRVNLNRILSEKGNPELQSLTSIFQELGFRLRVEPVRVKVKARRGKAVRKRMVRKPLRTV